MFDYCMSCVSFDAACCEQRSWVEKGQAQLSMIKIKQQ